MSHSVTITRTVTTSNTTSTLVVNTGYLKTLPGLLKLAQLVRHYHHFVTLIEHWASWKFGKMFTKFLSVSTNFLNVRKFVKTERKFMKMFSKFLPLSTNFVKIPENFTNFSGINYGPETHYQHQSFLQILGAVCVGLVAWYYDSRYNYTPPLFFYLMATTFLIGTFCLLVSCLFSLSTGGIISKTIYVSVVTLNTNQVVIKIKFEMFIGIDLSLNWSYSFDSGISNTIDSC